MSLASQLKNIATASASTVLDRKKRQKIHSASLIFDSKVAAAQDYSTILSHSLEALDELEEVNSVFGKFRNSLFSETSIGIDRNVQSKDQNRDLDNAIDSYLALIAPYWNSPLSYNSVEYLVRRFYIHIHNAESFLLSVLPYYNTPIFAKILSIIPTLPPIFSWLTNLKKTGKTPTREAIIRGGFNDVEFSQLYMEYVLVQVKRRFAYPNQLIFFVSSIVASLSYNSTNEVFLERSTGSILRTTAELLDTDRMETQVAASTILVVLAATIPLSDAIIDQIVAGVLNKPVNKKSALTSIYKTYQTIQGAPSAFPLKHYKQLVKLIHSAGAEVFENLVSTDASEGYKLFISFLRTTIRENAFEKLENLYTILDNVTLSTNLKTLLIQDSIKASSNQTLEDKSQLISFIEYIAKLDKDLFINILENEFRLTVSDLEMNLQTVLSVLKTQEVEEAEVVKPMLDISAKEGENAKEIQTVESLINENVHKRGSFLVLANEIDVEFSKLSQVFIRAVKFDLTKTFLSTVFQKDESIGLTFLLRIAVTEACPIIVRVEALDELVKSTKSLANNSLLITLFPIYLVLLSDANKTIRKKVVQLLDILRKNLIAAKANSKLSENLFLKDEIYGKENSSKIIVLSPKDSLKVTDILLANGSSLVIDKTQLFKVFESLVYKGSSCKKINDLVLAYLSVHSSIINLPYIKINLIRLTNLGTKCIKNSSASAFIYNDFLNKYFSDRQFWIDQCATAKLDFNYFESQVLDLLNLDNHVKNEHKKTAIISSLSFLQKAMNSNHQELVDASITKLVNNFSLLKIDYQIALAQNVIESANSEEVDVLYDPLLTLQSLTLTTDVFVKLLANFQLYKNSAQSAATSADNTSANANENVPKRRRRSSASTKQAMKKTEVTKLAEVHLRNVILLLETFEKVGPQLQPNSDLLVNLFNLLSDLETLGTDGNLPVLYAQESLANCLIISIKNSSKYQVKLDSNSIRADVLVSIIRSSNSPQLQNKLLLVIAELAILEPEFILHSIMPIFTFMGAYTVKQDDEYSSYVIEQTISKVIPALALNANSNGNKVEEIEFLLTSFISAFNHIPRHRRVNLFATLSSILGPENSIHIVLFLIGKLYSKAAVKHRYNECKLLVDFVKSLMKHFEITDQLSSIKNFLNLWSIIPNSKVNDSTSEEILTQIKSRSILGPEFLEMNDHELLLLKKNLVSFIERSIITESETSRHSLPYLKLQVATLLLDPRASQQQIDGLLDVFNAVIKLVLVELSSNIQRSVDTESEVFELQSKINKKFYRLLNDVLSLLPIKYFVESVIKLVELPHTEENIAVISNVIFLSSRQFDLETSDNEVSVESGNALSARLVQIVSDYANDKKPETLEIAQNSLDTLSSLINKFQQEFNSDFMMTLLSILTKVDANKVSFINDFESPELIISSLNLVSNIVSIIGIRTIGYLSKILPPSFEVFERSNKLSKKEDQVDAGDADSEDEDSDEDSDEDDDEQTTNQLVQTSVALLYSCFIKKIPQIMASSLHRILYELLNTNLIKKDIKLSILNIVFTHIDLKVLFKTLLNLWDSKEFERYSSSSIGLYLNLLTQTIESLEKSTTVSVASGFLKFMLSSFEFIRSNDETVFNKNAIARIESLLFSSELQFVMKLNDKSFRPIFSAAVSWAFDNNNLTTQDDFVRVVIFIKFFNKLQENLKSIITNYYSYFLDNIYALLDKFLNKQIPVDVNEEYILNVKRLVLISLNTSFKYDQDEYWLVNTRFEKMSLALTDQLAVTEAKIGKHLTKALTTLAVKNSKVADHNKALSKLLINHVKVDCSTQEKFSTIKVFENIFVKVGTSWLSLLPQFVPIIAELLEDDDEKIEMEVRSGLVKVIEDVLGESLDKYLD